MTGDNLESAAFWGSLVVKCDISRNKRPAAVLLLSLHKQDPTGCCMCSAISFS